MKNSPNPKASDGKKLFMLFIVFAFIILSIFVIKRFPLKKSIFVDELANQIEQEMANSQIKISAKGTRRTIADFKEPIITTHGKDSRLIVYTAHLSETISIADEGLWGWKWTSTYQDIVYEGEAQYTVNLSNLTEDDFVVNNELKTLTVKIPYAVLSPINIPANQIKFRDIQKGWLAPKDIKLTTEENTQLTIQVHDKMKAKLIDDNIIDLANKKAKLVVKDLFSTTVQAIDPEYTVVIVQ